VRGLSSGRQTYVYFVQHNTDGPIKIGRSSNPRARVMEMQTGNPYPLRILAVTKGSSLTEARFHRQFTHLRLNTRTAGQGERIEGSVRLAGNEWFIPAPELIEFIESLGAE
jgi:hypothetical protein